jgi:hypothetical protein
MRPIATIPFQHADRNLSRHRETTPDAKDILGHNTESHRPNSISPSLGELCALAVQNSAPSSHATAWRKDGIPGPPPSDSDQPSRYFPSSPLIKNQKSSIHI